MPINEMTHLFEGLFEAPINEMTHQQELLWFLELCIERDGVFGEPRPIRGLGDELATLGYVEMVGEKWRGIADYRITEVGREFVRKSIPPPEW